MCWHVPTCDIILGTSDTNHLDLICMLTCVSTYGHADMCRYVTICVDICRHVQVCANMWNHSWHLWHQLFGPYLHAGMCQHIWTCRHVLICADMCRYVPTCSITLGTSAANHLNHTCMLACVSTYGHTDMCWYVPTCTLTLGTSNANHLDLISMLVCIT